MPTTIPPRSPASANAVRWVWWVGGCLLILQTGLLQYSIVRQSTTADEYGHLAAGIRYHQWGDTDIFRVNPPLVRWIAALPASRYDWGLRPEVWSPLGRPEFDEGRRLEAKFPQRFERSLRAGRRLVGGFAIAGSVAIFLLGRRLAGPVAGLLTSSLWVFQPQVLSHGALITNDIPVAVTVAFSLLALMRYLDAPSGLGAAKLAVLLAIATLCKFTGLLLFPISLLVLGLQRHVALSHRLVHGAALATIYLSGIALPYAYAGFFQSLRDLQLVSGSFQGLSPGLLGALPLPLASDFVRGLDRQQLDFETGLPSYAWGQSSRHGWWWFYPFSMLVKLPIGTWLALTSGACWLPFDRRVGGRHRDALLALVVAGFFLIVLMRKDGFAQQHRYVLVIYPMLFCLVALAWNGAAGLHKRSKRVFAKGVLVMACGLNAAETALAADDWLGSFNFLCGGSGSGHRYLFNDAVDWGQDTRLVESWLAENRGSRRVHFFSHNSYRGRWGRPRGEAVANQPELAIVSRSNLGLTDELPHQIPSLRPIDRIGQTHLVYQIQPRSTSSAR